MKKKFAGENEQSPNEMNMAHGGFTPDWKEELGQYMNTNFSTKQTNAIPQNMAFGEDDVQPNQSTQPPDLEPQIPFNPQSGLPPTPVPPAQASVAPLQAQLGGYKADLAKYGPEQQIAVQNDIINRQNSFPNRLGLAGAGFADALMAVGGKQSPGFMKAMQDKQSAQGAAQMETMRNAQAGKMSQIGMQNKLAMDDPNSPLSKIAKKAQGPTLLKLGWTPQQIDEVSGNTIDEAAKSGLGYFESKSRADEAKALHEMQAGTAGKTLAEIHAKNTEEAQARKDALAQRNEEFTSAHPIITGLKSLVGSVGSPTASVGPLGATTVKDGKTYEWSPTSNAYHLKK